MKILVATNNRGKLLELARLLDVEGLQLVLPVEVGLHELDVPETGETYFENASLKAKAFAKTSGLMALADDSGLEVDALGGEPGIYAKRYAGENATDEYRIAFLLKKLENVAAEQRTARFVAALVLADPHGHVIADTLGYCEGAIGFEPHGTNGFGYDPIFLPSETPGKTMAELDDATKDAVSHRGNAARKIAPLIRQLSGLS
jgi:XTP/dITP diphosphohydrolase